MDSGAMGGLWNCFDYVPFTHSTGSMQMVDWTHDKVRIHHREEKVRECPFEV